MSGILFDMYANSNIGAMSAYSITYIAPYENISFDISVENPSQEQPKLGSIFNNTQWEALRSVSARRSQLTTENVDINELYNSRIRPTSPEKPQLLEMHQAQRNAAKHSKMQRLLSEKMHRLEIDRTLPGIEGRNLIASAGIAQLQQNLFSTAHNK